MLFPYFHSLNSSNATNFNCDTFSDSLENPQDIPIVFRKFIKPISFGFFVFALFAPILDRLPGVREQAFSTQQLFPWIFRHIHFLLPNDVYTFLEDQIPLFNILVSLVMHYMVLCMLQWGYILLFVVSCFGAPIQVYLGAWAGRVL